MMADHWDVSQLISREFVSAAHGCLPSANVSGQYCSTHRQRRTTTVSLFAGMKPSMKTFLLPQL